MATIMGKSTGNSTNRFLTIAVWVIGALVIIGAIVAALLLNSGGSPRLLRRHPNRRRST